MTWLHGVVQWQNLQDTLTKLIAGEVADDYGTTVPAGTAWLRDVAGQDFLCTPASVGYTIPDHSYRTGYFLPLDQNTEVGDQTSYQGYNQWFSPRVNDHNSFCRVSTIASALSNTRQFLVISVTTANTTAADYSTLRATITYYNCDTGAQINSFTNQAPNSSGQFSSISGFTSLVVTVGNPVTGIVPVGATFARYFDNTFKGGVDCWPMLKEKQGTYADPSFTVAPPGTVTTDYAIVNQPIRGSGVLATAANTTINTNQYDGLASGLGIKTSTGLGSGALYTVTGFATCRNRIRILGGANAVTAGTVDLETFGGYGVEPSTSTYMRIGGQKVLKWLQCFKTPGSVGNTDTVEYYMSVKADQLVLIAQGNPSATAQGKLCATGCLALRTDVQSDDRYPMAVAAGARDYTTDITTSPGNTCWAKHWLWETRGCEAPLRDLVFGSANPRDWYTGWSRPDMWKKTTMALSAPTGGSDNPTACSLHLPNDWQSNPSVTPSYGGLMPGSSIKPHPTDSKWWLYPLPFIDCGGLLQQSVNLPNSPGIRLKRNYRGATDDSVCWLPEGGWASGDELYDSSSGKKWLLVKPDFWSFITPFRSASSTYHGGLAILET